MATSWTGDLPERARAEGEATPAVSTISPGGEWVRDVGTPLERRTHEIFLSGPIGAALRLHLEGSGTPAAEGPAIALFDPVRMWAPALVKSLSDAGGQPLERLVLRDAARLTTLATIERTRVVRRLDAALSVCHADVPSGVADSAAVPLVLLERAQLAAVIVGPMHPESVTGMLEMLLAATHASTWRCPNLLFMLPPAAVWIANKVSGLGWPQPLHLSVLNESLNSAQAVWSALLGIWNHAQSVSLQKAAADEPPVPSEAVLPIHVEAAAPESIAPLRLDLVDGAPAATAQGLRPPPATLDRQRVEAALQTFIAGDGMLACAIIDAGSGEAIAQAAREAIDVGLVAAAATQLLRAHRAAARQIGFADPVEEVVVSAGSRQQLLRLLRRHPGLFACAVLDANRGNLALARYKLLEFERALA